jgi:predicted RNA polymerase sigma factor
MSEESKAPDQNVSNDVAAQSAAPALPRQDSTWNDLAARMKRGDAKALAELYDATSPILYGMLLRIVGDAAAAQETLVDAYARAWSSIHTFDPERSNLMGWLVLLARTVAFERPDRQPPAPVGAAADDRQIVERAFFEGVRESGLRGALARLRRKKGEGA